jgi:hypothetical protein
VAVGVDLHEDEEGSMKMQRPMMGKRFIVRNGETNTTPYVIHANGCRQLSLWKWLLNEYLKHDTEVSSPATNLEDNLTIFTWNTTKQQSAAEISLKRMNVPHVVIGQNHNWYVGAQTEWTLEFLEECKTPYCMGIDAFDLIVLASPAKIMQTYMSYFQNKVVYGAEMGSWPKHEELEQFEAGLPGASGRYKHLNAGMFIGPTELLRKVYGKANEKKDKPEGGAQQVWARRAHKELYPEVVLDYNCQIFQSLFGLGRGELDAVWLDSSMRMATA